MPSLLQILHQEVVACRRCERLTVYRETIGREKRRAYMDWEYWAKPVPGFGDPNARVLLLGLAPGAHGSNRTGRPFTGDASGNFMYPILYKTGFASQPTAERLNDGMKLIDCYITAAVRCAPPDNKPTPEEIAACAPYLDREIAALKNLQVVVALGKIGFEAYLNYAKRNGFSVAKKRLHVWARRGIQDPERSDAAGFVSSVKPEHGYGETDGSDVYGDLSAGAETGVVEVISPVT